jgi:excinuclease UvrABC ATPase subunit
VQADARLTGLLHALRDKGNTVLVVEHGRDVITAADDVIDVGPGAGDAGGRIVFTGEVAALTAAETLTGRYLSAKPRLKGEPRIPTGSLPVTHARLHNLRDLSVDIPTGVLTAISGVTGSGKSTLIHGAFCAQHPHAAGIDQSAPHTNRRSTTITYTGAAEHIRTAFAKASNVSPALFRDYLRLGQPLTSLSSGECQRIKLATHLRDRSTTYVLDEPTTGWHMSDVERLLDVLDRLVDDYGATVVVIEHNLDVIAHADWVIDLGPDGGSKGGQLLFQGRPQNLLDVPGSRTATYLRQAVNEFA